jgi:MFS family permease
MSLKTLRPVLPILIGASLMLSVAMGLRQSLGIFIPALTKDVGISVSQFTLAIAIQNLAWGFLQPLAGAWAVRLGYRPMMVGGSLLYVCGLILLATSHGIVGVTLGAGVAIGASMACTGSALSLAVSARSVPAAMRSTVIGMVSAAGSLGALVAAPVGQVLTQAHGWRVGIAGFVVLALIMVPAA